MPKQCSKCQQVKPAVEFYADKRTGDGLSGSCRSCILKQRADRREAMSPAQVAELRERNRDYQNKFRSTPEGRRAARRNRTRPTADVERRGARNAIAMAKRRGLQPPRRCQGCRVKFIRPLQAHHHKGYQKQFWLDVVWLCPRCHGKEHRHAIT